jgi:hypothetical protein
VSKMEAIASTQQLKQWVAQLVANDEWLDLFDADTSRLNKVMILTVIRPFDGKKVDAIGIVPKEALKPFGLHESFIDRPIPAHKLIAHDAMSIMVRCVVMPHDQTAMVIGRDPNTREVDYCDFTAAEFGVKDFVHRTLVHQRHTAKFGQQIANFLSKGVKPIIVMS